MPAARDTTKQMIGAIKSKPGLGWLKRKRAILNRATSMIHATSYESSKAAYVVPQRLKEKVRPEKRSPDNHNVTKSLSEAYLGVILLIFVHR